MLTRRFARREGIICVRPDWVKDCLDARCWLDEAPYLVVEQESQPGQIRCLECGHGEQAGSQWLG